MLSSRRSPIDPVRTALVVVDAQNDYYSLSGVLAPSQDYTLIDQSLQPQINLLRAATAAGCLVVLVRTVIMSDHSNSSPAYLYGRIRSNKNYSFGTVEWCVEGTWGSEVFRDVKDESPNAVEVIKNRSSGFVNTNLDLVLRSGGIDAIVLTGVATDGCVAATARDGNDYGYRTIVASDAVGSFKPHLHELALRTLGARLEVLDSSSIIRWLQQVAE